MWPRIFRIWGIAVTVGARRHGPAAAGTMPADGTPVSPWSWEIVGQRGARPLGKLLPGKVGPRPSADQPASPPLGAVHPAETWTAQIPNALL